MMTTANYVLTAAIGKEQYLFEYDALDVWAALDEFWHEDYPLVLDSLEGSEWFPFDVRAVAAGQVVTTYEFGFNASMFHYFYDHGRITLDEFERNLREDRREMDAGHGKEDAGDNAVRPLQDELIYVRVLEQDTCDQIRIGWSHPVFRENIEKEVEGVKKAYDERLSWCGGWTDENNNKYHKRIALVDAETLQPVMEIWNKEK